MKRKTLGFLALSVSALLVLQTPTTAMAGVWVNDAEAEIDEDTKTYEHTGDVSNNYEHYEEENIIGAVSADSAGDSLTVTGDVTSSNEPELPIVPEPTDPEAPKTYHPSPVVASNGGEITINGNVSAENATAVVADADDENPGGKVTVNGNVSSNHSEAVGAFNGGNAIVNGNATSIDGPAVIADGNNSSVTVTGNVSSDKADAIGAFNGGSVTVNGNVASNDGSGIITGGDNSAVTVTGNVSSSINAEGNNSTVTVNGDVSSSINAIGNNSTITVNGSVSSGTITAPGDNTTININGDVASNSGINLLENFHTDAHSTVNVTGNVYSGIGCYWSDINVDGNVHSKNHALHVNFSTVNIDGDVTSEGHCAIGSDSSTVNVNGNVSGGDWAIISYCPSSNVTVNGNVTGGVTTNSDEPTTSHSIELSNGGSVTVKGNVETANKGLDNESAIIILPTSFRDDKGKLIVLGDVTAHGKDGNAIWIDSMYNSETGQRKPSELKDLPSMLVGSLNADSKDLLVGFDTNNGNTDEENKALLESIYDNIMYYINIEQPSNGQIDVSGAFSSDGYLVAHEDDSISISVNPNEGYEVDSVAGGKVDVIKNADGSYTIIVPRGGGIKISALLKAIEKVVPASSVVKVKSSESSSSPVLTAAQSYSVFNNTIQKDIANVPQNGTMNIDMGNWISFNKKTFELLSKRSDIAITITYKYNGQTYRVTIPAGYPLMDLLDENGYCGCLYLNSLFGSELVSK